MLLLKQYEHITYKTKQMGVKTNRTSLKNGLKFVNANSLVLKYNDNLSEIGETWEI
jgi:hypothetical protein